MDLSCLSPAVPTPGGRPGLIVLILGSLSLCGCLPQTVSFGSIKEPVLLNSRPIPVGGDSIEWKTVGRFGAQVTQMVMAASEPHTNTSPGQSYSTTSESNRKNTVQYNAFMNIVGYRGRGISDVSIQINGFGINGLFALYLHLNMLVEGKILEQTQPEDPKPAPEPEPTGPDVSPGEPPEGSTEQKESEDGEPK